MRTTLCPGGTSDIGIVAKARACRSASLTHPAATSAHASTIHRIPSSVPVRERYARRFVSVKEHTLNLPPLRAATAEDIGVVLDLLRLAHREAPIGRWDEDCAREMVEDCLRNGAVLLSLSHGQPVGTLGVTVSRVRWSKDVLLQDTWTFVHPAHRRAPHARALLLAARDMAKAAKLPLLIGIQSSIRPEAKQRLFESVFGKPIGANFLVREG